MQTSRSRASRVSVGGCALAVLGLLFAAAPPVARGSTVTCDYTASTHRVRITITGSIITSVQANRSGQILVHWAWCDNQATVTNTDRITILAGAGDQQVNLHWDGAGFKPGATNEVGDSDEIEIAVSLDGDDDRLLVGGGRGADKITAGKSSGFGVAGRVNLNAGESTGIDADVTLVLGLERLLVNGDSGADIVSGAGGAGTGGAFTLPMTLIGNLGNDTLTGGAASDEIYGAAGNDTLAGGAGGDWLNGGGDADTLKGGDGPDLLTAVDGVSGNDQLYGGAGIDTCNADPGDSLTNC